MNRFDKPVEGLYVSQYVPIPFEQLYQLGKYYNEEVDKAELELSTAVNKWSEFRSPSAVDTKLWYDYTIGGAKLMVSDMVNNPDLLKTAEGRSRITSYINSRPYDVLSNLLLSRDAMLERLKANLTLALNGKYNPLWHNVNFTDYSTTKGGIFKDTAPLAFKSVRELTEPFVNDLKDEFITSKRGYDYFGVTKQRALNQVNTNWSSIYNTPEAQKHIQTLMNQGLTQDQAIGTFRNMVNTAAQEYSRVNRNANDFAKIAEEYRQRKNLAKGDEQPGGKPFYITLAMDVSGKALFGQAARTYLSERNPEYKKALIESHSADPILSNAAKNKMREMDKEATPKTFFRNILKSYGNESKEGKIQLTNESLKQATNDVLNNFSYKVSGGYTKLFLDRINGITDKESSTPFGDKRILNGGENLTLTSRYIANIAGFNSVDAGRNKVENALKGGKLVGMVVLDNNQMMSIPSTGGKSINTQNIKVAVPVSTVKNAGINYGEMVRAGGQYVSNPTYISSSSSRTSKKDTPKSEVSRESYKGEEGYYILNLTNNLPSTGDGMDAEYLNQEALKYTTNESTSSSLYPDVLNKSWGF